jgi:hypothetical protein
MKGEDDFSEEPLVVMTDEEGNEYYYIEEEVIAIGTERFAVLVPVDAEGGGAPGLEDGDAVIAKIVVDEEGEDIYRNPTDEEFEQVLRIYEERDEMGDEDE